MVASEAGGAAPSGGVPARVVVVTGMHRSGTSVITGALRFLGVSLGDPARHLPPGPDNPKGYFEVKAIMQLDDELLGLLGGAWDQPPVLDPGWEHDARLDDCRVRAAEILDETFGPAGTWAGIVGWKDPRLSLLLPFWRTVVPVDRTIVVVREPGEVAASLRRRRYAVGSAQAASLWLRYVFAATASDPGHLLVRHTDVFDDPAGTLARLAAHIGAGRPDAGAEAALRGSLDAGLRHHDAAAAPAEDGNPLLDLARLIWDGGALDLDAVPGPVADLFARGWLRPPIDGELLARARAELVTARESLRQANRRIATLEARLAQPAGDAPSDR